MWKIPTSSSIPKFRAIVIYVTGFVLLLKLLENYLNIFYKFKGAWKLLKNEKFRKTRKKNIESYLVQERLGKKMCRHYCKQTLRKALFFFVGFPVAKTPKSTGSISIC